MAPESVMSYSAIWAIIPPLPKLKSRHWLNFFMSEKSVPSTRPSISGGISPRVRYASKYFLNTLSMPSGRDGKMPRGRLVLSLTCSQRHRGHSRSIPTPDGDTFIIIVSVFPLKYRQELGRGRGSCPHSAPPWLF